MNLSELTLHISVCDNIFVWIELSDNNCGFIRVAKIAIRELICGMEIKNDEGVYATVVDSELYIGAPPPADP